MRSPDPADGDAYSDNAGPQWVDLSLSMEPARHRHQLTHQAIFPPPAEVRIPKALLLSQPRN